MLSLNKNSSCVKCSSVLYMSVFRPVKYFVSYAYKTLYCSVCANYFCGHIKILCITSSLRSVYAYKLLENARTYSRLRIFVIFDVLYVIKCVYNVSTVSNLRNTFFQ